MHNYERIITAAANSKPSKDQLEQWAKRPDYNKDVAQPQNALIGWDGGTINVGDIIEVSGYAEPGYDDPKNGILLGNWNHCSRRVQDILERAGYELEWEDEWTTCENCGKAVRTSADSYGWQRSYVLLHEYETICRTCLLENESDMSDYLESLENNAKSAVARWIDPAAYGYSLVNDSFENGFHPGQSDDPKKILAEALAAEPSSKFLFRISDVGQFDISFELWRKDGEPTKHTFQGNYNVVITMTLQQAESASHQGQCDDDVKALAKIPEIAEQLAAIDPEALRKELKEYGAWDAAELSDHEQNLQRILWLAANDIKEEHSK